MVPGIEDQSNLGNFIARLPGKVYTVRQLQKLIRDDAQRENLLHSLQQFDNNRRAYGSIDYRKQGSVLFWKRPAHLIHPRLLQKAGFKQVILNFEIVQVQHLL